MTSESQSVELHWQMTTCEKSVFKQVVRDVAPQVAVEVGTYKGGSLQVLHAMSQEVVSIDIDPSVGERLSPLFPRAQFRSGESAKVLPEVLREVTEAGRAIAFILIDGDHTRTGVQRDIESLLHWQPTCECVVLMHDSFNPECRAGICSADWQSSRFVHDVEVDYVPGIFHEVAFDTAAARTMWGGFARAVLRPTGRRGALEVKTSQQGLFEAVYKASSHRRKPVGSRIMRVVRRRLVGSGA